jgi:ankyrin repeat protein
MLFGRQQATVISKSVYLVESGADVSARENEALRLAFHYGHFDIVKYLISMGADPRVLGY